MKRIFTTLLVLGMLFGFGTQLNAQNKTCGTAEVMAKLFEDHPRYKERHQAAVENTKAIAKAHAQEQQQSHQHSRAVRTIPVVFHVIYNNSAENLSDNVLNAALQTMNEDFRKMNSDFSNTRSTFQGVAADAEIEFCLASVDPDGNPTTGIVRVQTNKTQWSYSTETHDMKSSSTGGSDGWPFDEYYNIWIVDLDSYNSQTGGTAAYALLPSVGSQWEAIDGTVADYETVSGGDRTLTHETGHYLNLYHPWGSGSGSCGDDDGFSDTPNTDGPTYNCPQSQVACGVLTQWENFMDYSFCSTMFTAEQAAEMNSILSTNYNSSWPGTVGRASLNTSQGCQGQTSPVSADFIGTPTFGTPGTTVQFTDQSTGSIVSWNWNFGDGGTSTQQNPSHTYNTVGLYTVTLTVSDGTNSDTRTRTSYIDISTNGGGTCDTIYSPFINGTNIELRPSEGGGYATGNNGYGDFAKAEAYPLSQPREIPSLIVWFGDVITGSGDPNSSVVLGIYSMDGTGTVNGGGTGPAPGTLLGGGALPVSSVTTANPILLGLPNPISVSSDYAVFVDFTQLSAGDSVAVYQTVDGDGNSADRAWEQWDDGLWYTMLYSWPLDIDLALIPIECPQSITGIELEEVNQIMNVYPNPAQDGMFSVQYSLTKKSDVTISVYDAIGKELFNTSAQNVTNDRVEVDLSTESEGVYFVRLTSDNGSLVRKVVLTR